MNFKKTPTELIDFITIALNGYQCESRKMFGAIAFFVNGNMFTGAHQSDLFLRLSAADQNQIKKECDEVTNFEPMPGRKMSEYITIPESIFSEQALLRKWLDKSYGYASKIPAKKKKEPKSKAKLKRTI
jgi:TfoX/Sxy family transcriptional regulator of competence genes